MAKETQEAKAARLAKLKGKIPVKTPGFLVFVREQGVVGMAVGLAIGLAATETVRTVVDGFVSPVVGFLLAGVDLSQRTWNTGLSRGGEDLVIAWGAIANSAIFLLGTAFVIYYVVRMLKLDKLDKKKD